MCDPISEPKFQFGPTPARCWFHKRLALWAGPGPKLHLQHRWFSTPAQPIVSEPTPAAGFITGAATASIRSPTACLIRVMTAPVMFSQPAAILRVGGLSTCVIPQVPASTHQYRLQ